MLKHLFEVLYQYFLIRISVFWPLDSERKHKNYKWNYHQQLTDPFWNSPLFLGSFWSQCWTRCSYLPCFRLLGPCWLVLRSAGGDAQVHGLPVRRDESLSVTDWRSCWLNRVQLTKMKEIGSVENSPGGTGLDTPGPGVSRLDKESFVW